VKGTQRTSEKGTTYFEREREMGVATVTELKQSISGKRTFRPSLITRHANEW
jgi:hypothetical protein